jgi:hypothetical protein
VICTFSRRFERIHCPPSGKGRKAFVMSRLKGPAEGSQTEISTSFASARISLALLACALPKASAAEDQSQAPNGNDAMSIHGGQDGVQQHWVTSSGWRFGESVRAEGRRLGLAAAGRASQPGDRGQAAQQCSERLEPGNARSARLPGNPLPGGFTSASRPAGLARGGCHRGHVSRPEHRCLDHRQRVSASRAGSSSTTIARRGRSSPSRAPIPAFRSANAERRASYRLRPARSPLRRCPSGRAKLST